jgi:hypothetical protein
VRPRVRFGIWFTPAFVPTYAADGTALMPILEARDYITGKDDEVRDAAQRRAHHPPLSNLSAWLPLTHAFQASGVLNVRTPGTYILRWEPVDGSKSALTYLIS